MKYCIIALLFLYSCGSTAQMQNKADKNNEKININKIDSAKAVLIAQPDTIPFEFEEATSQKFSGGAPGSNLVYMYQVKLKKLTDKRLSFKNLWTNPNSLSVDFQLKRKFQTDEWANYKSDDELMLYAQKTEYGEAAQQAMKKYKTEIKKGKQAPYAFKSGGLIEYEYNGTTYYYEIENITRLPAVAAP